MADKIVFVGFIADVLWPSSLWALRPISTNDAYVVDVGVIELEIGVDFVCGNDDETKHALCSCVTTGLSDRLDLGVAVNHETIKNSEETRQGLDESELGLKYALIKDIFSITYIFSPGNHGYGLNGIFTKGLGHLTRHLNLGYVRTDVEGEEGTTTWGGALEIPLARKTILVPELTAESKSTVIWKGLVGAYFPITETLTIDIGLEKEISRRSSGARLTFGLTRTF